MILHFISNKIHIKEDNKTFHLEDYTLWFSGYFFVDDKYYSEKSAAKHILNLFTLNNLENSISNLNGIFTSIIINKDTCKITVCNDRFGFGQLFYSTDKNKLIISSSFWELTQQLNESEINEEAIAELVLMRYVFSGHTVVKNISEILPASIYTFEQEKDRIKIKRKTYWKFNYSPSEIDSEDAEKKIYDCLNNIIKRYKTGIFQNKKIGINLTGGADSRFILSLLLQNNVPKHSIYSYTYGDRNCEDIKIATRVVNSMQIKQENCTFSYPFFDFYSPETIKEIVHKVGHLNTYYQGYGALRLQPFYCKSDFLLTGTDGFVIGLLANEELYSIKDNKKLTEYLYKTIAPRINQSQSGALLGRSVGELENRIKEKLNYFIENNNEDCISTYYEWLFRNKIRKNILSIYELLNEGTQPLFPFYDYDFFDLMLSLPSGALFKQQAYINAMFKFSFKGDFKELGSISFENRKTIYSNTNFTLVNKKNSLVRRGLLKVFGIPSPNATFTSFKTFRYNKKKTLNLIKQTTNKGSTFINIDYLFKMINENKKKEGFFYYGLAPILTVIHLEEKLRTINKKPIE